MAVVTATVNKKRFVFRPLPAQQMRAIAEASLAAEKARIVAGLNTKGEPTKALSDAYARRKEKRGMPAVRDLLLSGKTMNAIRVKSATPERIVMGATDPLAQLVLNKANQKERVWGPSRAGRQALNAGIQAALKQTDVIRFEKI